MTSYSSPRRVLLWFRGKDLRTVDHLGLEYALKAGAEVLPLFIIDPYFFDPVRAQSASHRMQFLVESLRELKHTLTQMGSKLHFVHGRCQEVLPRIVSQWNATEVVAQGWSDPLGRRRDEGLQATLSVPLTLLDGETLRPPGTLRTQGGTPFKVFTPFARQFRAKGALAPPKPAPSKLPSFPTDFAEVSAPCPSVESLGLVHNPRLQAGGESAAQQRLAHFIQHGLAEYNGHRDRMDLDGTSRLSADLKFGTLSPRQVWHAVVQAKGHPAGRDAYLNELIWREFSHSTLWDQPTLLTQPFRPKWTQFPWRADPQGWEAWTTGQTGYPIVDAAARQLLASGFVHNRARMISASFLTKHLLIDYRRGAAHYLQWLTDGDWAQNTAGWQWSAGCGCDAQPYFRIFNPMTQGKRFDPHGAYVRRWVPELASLPDRYIHAPWEMPPLLLTSAGITLGDTYPFPIVDHREARSRYLDTAKTYLKP